jgi:hypothetical protein
VDAYVVDEVGGKAANMLAMYGAWRNLAAAQPDFVLIDGKGLPKVRHPAVCVALPALSSTWRRAGLFLQQRRRCCSSAS